MIKYSVKLKVFFLLMPLMGFCQYKISGSVKNMEGDLLQSVIILLINPDNKVMTTITDENGSFYFSASKNNYSLTIQHKNFKYYAAKFDVGKSIILDTIILETEEINLEEMIITSKKPQIEQKIDRYVFNVAQSVMAMGNDGVQLLRKTSGVQISGNNIILAGKGKVRIMVNDKLLVLSGDDLINYLQTLQSNDISAIEVITNPSARYDAQGNSGLINIKLKRNRKENLNGNISTAYSQATYASANIGMGINYKKDKFSIAGALNYGDGSIKETSHEKIFYPTTTRISNEQIEAYNKYTNGRISANYELNDNTTIGIQYSLNKSFPDKKDNILVNYLNPVINIPDGTQITSGKTNSDVTYTNLGGYYQVKLDTLGRKISVGADYFLYNSSRDRMFASYDVAKKLNENTSTYAENSGRQDIKIYTATVDAEIPYSWANVEMGGKFSFIDNKNAVSFTNITADTLQSDRFSYLEKVIAVYTTVYRKFSKWEAKAGIRFEHTNTEGISVSLNHTNKNIYYSFFPSAYLSFNLNDSHKFTLNYGRRINRPSYEALNPFKWYLNLSSYRTGNPFLKPEYINTIEFSHIYRNTFISKFYVSKTANWYERVTYIAANSPVQAYIYENYATFYTIGLSESYSFVILDRWESNNQIMAFYNYSDIQLAVLNKNTEGMSGYLSTNNSFTINTAKTLFAEINYLYQLPAFITQYKMGGFQQIDFGMKFQVCDKQLQFGINASDVFKTNRPLIVGYTNNIRQEYKNYNDLRRVIFSINYTFGNDKIKSNKQTFGNQQETGRAL